MNPTPNPPTIAARSETVSDAFRDYWRAALIADARAEGIVSNADWLGDPDPFAFDDAR